MEDWKRDFEWLKVRHYVKKSLGRSSLPDLNGILLLIGVQELGHLQETFTKEEKQDLMHIGVCRLLSQDGYFDFVGRDADGWPHYEEKIPFTTKGAKEQEQYLIEKVIDFFKDEEE